MWEMPARAAPAAPARRRHRKVAARLRPLYDLLLGSPKPETARGWLYKPHVAPLLAELATGQRELTHEGLHTYPHRNVTSHTRALLISCGVLPDADKQLLDYERWLTEQLQATAGHPHARLLRQFGRWDLLARMRAATARGPLPPTAANNARRRFRAATNFLTWLHENNTPRHDLNQAAVDTWYLTLKPSQRMVIVAFWNWATANRHLPRLRLPRMRFRPGEAMTQQTRLDLIRRCLSTPDGLPSTRVVVCLMLLYGQQLPRILRLTLDDITHDPDGNVLIRFADPPTPSPNLLGP